MKKINYVLLIVWVTIGTLILYSCSSDKNKGQEVKLTAISSLDRIRQDEPLFGESQAIIKAAKNEYESFQIVIGALQKNVRVVNVEMSDLTGSAGTISKENITLFREEYVRLMRPSPRAQLPTGLYTDPLVLLSIHKQANQLNHSLRPEKDGEIL